MATKWVYMFTEGNADMRNLLGGKGANLAEMTNLGLPVPQGFTITTEARGKTHRKIVDISNYYLLKREFCLCTAGEQSALRAVAQCAGDPHHRHCKQLEIERFWAAFLFIPSHPARLHTFVSTGKLLTMCLRVL